VTDLNTHCSRCGKLFVDGEEATLVKVTKMERLPWNEKDGVLMTTKLVDSLIHTAHVREDAERIAAAGSTRIEQAFNSWSLDRGNERMAPVYTVGGALAGFGLGLAIGDTLGGGLNG